MLVPQAQAFLDASPQRASVSTDTRPNSTTNCWQVWYFVLIEREARPHPDLTPVTSPLSPPSSHASLPSQGEYLSIFLD